jgi:type II secretion system protein I
MNSHGKGFVLLEALIAVAIFAIAVIALGRCVSNCLAAERLQFEDARARQVLENRVAELELGAVPITKSSTETLKAPYDGWKLTETAVPLVRKNELGQKLADLQSVTLQLTWKSDGETHKRELIFYANAPSK